MGRGMAQTTRSPWTDGKPSANCVRTETLLFAASVRARAITSIPAKALSLMCCGGIRKLLVKHGSRHRRAGVQPRIVSLWRHRYADHGVEGLQDKPRPGKQPIYTKATDKRILRQLDKPPPEGFARWTGPLLAGALGDVDVQYVWRFLRSHKIDL